MIHVKALPGTPKYDGNFNAIIEQAKYEASIYRKHEIVCIRIEIIFNTFHAKSETISIFLGCCFGGEYARRSICARQENRLGSGCVDDTSL